MRGQFSMSAIMGLLQGVGMAIIGVPFALFIGVLAAIMEFIPNYWHYHCGVCGGRHRLDTKLDNGTDYPYLHHYPGLC